MHPGAARQLTEYSRSTTANVETGRQHVPPRFWERADAALRTGGTLASAHDELQAAARRDLRSAARQVSTARQAQARHDDLDPIPALPPGRALAATPRQPAVPQGLGSLTNYQSWRPANRRRSLLTSPSHCRLSHGG